MYESSTKELSGCASNLLAHKDLGHLRRPIVGIYKIEDFVPCPDGTLLGVEGKLGNTDM